MADQISDGRVRSEMRNRFKDYGGRHFTGSEYATYIVCRLHSECLDTQFPKLSAYRSPQRPVWSDYENNLHPHIQLYHLRGIRFAAQTGSSHMQGGTRLLQLGTSDAVFRSKP